MILLLMDGKNAVTWTNTKYETKIFAQKNFTHSFWLNLMMAAILNSAMLDSDTAILDQTPCYLL